MSISEYNKLTRIDSSLYARIPKSERNFSTDKDVLKGWFHRYFMSNSNGKDLVREVSKKTYFQFIDNPFWIGVILKWNIVNNEARELNLNQIRMGLRTINDLDVLLPNLLEYHRSGEYVSTGVLTPSTTQVSPLQIFDK